MEISQWKLKNTSKMTKMKTLERGISLSRLIFKWRVMGIEVTPKRIWKKGSEGFSGLERWLFWDPFPPLVLLLQWFDDLNFIQSPRLKISKCRYFFREFFFFRIFCWEIFFSNTIFFWKENPFKFFFPKMAFLINWLWKWFYL